jgi:hypothetical protein
MVDMVAQKRCRRIVIDEIMDGATTRIHCEEDEEACDCCQWERFDWEAHERGRHTTEGDSGGGGRSIAEQEGVADKEKELFQAMLRGVEWQSHRVRERVSQEAADMERFQDIYRRWRGVCAACRTEEGLDDEHNAEGCVYKGREGWSRVQARAEEIRRELFTKKRIRRFAGCYTCGWPQQMCQSWEADRSDGGRLIRRRGIECGEKDMLIEQVATFWTICEMRDEDFSAFLQRSVGGLGEEEDIWEWMGRRCMIGELEGNHLCKAWFVWIQELEE